MIKDPVEEFSIDVMVFDDIVRHGDISAPSQAKLQSDLTIKLILAIYHHCARFLCDIITHPYNQFIFQPHKSINPVSGVFDGGLLVELVHV